MSEMESHAAVRGGWHLSEVYQPYPYSMVPVSQTRTRGPRLACLPEGGRFQLQTMASAVAFSLMGMATALQHGCLPEAAHVPRLMTRRLD